MRRFFALVIVALLSVAPIASAEPWRVFDSADLFTAEEVEEIEQSISDFQRKTNMDFAVLTTDDYLGSADNIGAFAIWFYDSMALGFGHRANGMIYYIDMNNRIPYLSTCGDMVDVFDSTTIDNAHEACYQFLVDGKYSEAVLKMIEFATESYTEYKKGR